MRLPSGCGQERGVPLSRNPFWPNLSSMAGVILYGLFLYAPAGGRSGVCLRVGGPLAGRASAAARDARRAPAAAARRVRAVAVHSDPLAQGAGPRMTRAHRSLHRIVWPILAVLVALGVALALWLRPPPDHAAAPAMVVEHPA